ncbi:hypothetical protein SEA_NIKLAS_61 [Mycobacterium Phage Niklas]|uniref:Uncharacterized protein n=1 Tax=Mycobacterium Phage Niklas TaxID=2517936 RepID=A0A482JDB7_9CAUD|nr:hypothetical protein I5H04_gp42 [Mycobacterium Phage Niklas]QBP31643.1 hypothetical protein SEA_NIKLAS_61 [Mycobacterium Phage Niklas]
MSSNNFAHVGRVVIPSDHPLSPSLRGMVNKAAVIVGVRADLGQVVVAVDGERGAPMPTMPPAQAAQLGAMITQAAAAADELHAAYKAYQAALDDAERKLAEAMKGGSTDEQ